MSPLISIIIPVFNRIEYLEESINSVIAQKFKSWELLLIDDGSEPKVVQETQKMILGKKNIRFFERSHGPKGASTCRNIGISKSKGEYVIFLDSDDLLSSECLSRRFRMFETNYECDFLVFQMQKFYNKVGDSKAIWNVGSNEDDLVRFARKDAVWSISGPIWKKDFLYTLGGFDESFTNAQDLELHIRALLRKPNYKKFLNEQPDCFNRWHEKESISQSGYVINKRTYRAQIKLLEILLNNMSTLNSQFRNSVQIFSYNLISELIFLNYHTLREETMNLTNQNGVFNSSYKIRLTMFSLANKVFSNLRRILAPKDSTSIYKYSLIQNTRNV